MVIRYVVAILIFGVAAVGLALMPRARRFDRERRAKRIADGKSPGRVPRNLAAAIAIVVIIVGGIVFSLH
jgi:hypothetical protein